MVRGSLVYQEVWEERVGEILSRIAIHSRRHVAASTIYGIAKEG